MYLVIYCRTENINKKGSYLLPLVIHACLIFSISNHIIQQIFLGVVRLYRLREGSNTIQNNVKATSKITATMFRLGE